MFDLTEKEKGDLLIWKDVCQGLHVGEEPIDCLDVRLGDTAPHLFITFDTGMLLFVNGHHDKYECW